MHHDVQRTETILSYRQCEIAYRLERFLILQITSLLEARPVNLQQIYLQNSRLIGTSFFSMHPLSVMYHEKQVPVRVLLILSLRVNATTSHPLPYN